MKVAVVGTGSIGRRHLKNLLQLGIKDVFAISEHSRKSSIDIDGTNVQSVDNYARALEPDVTAVVIGNPTSLHLDYLRRAVAVGKHVYLEKPAAMDEGGLAPIVKHAADSGLVVAMGTMYRFNARLERLRERVLAGDCGLILSVETLIGEHIADYHPDEDYRIGYAARAELGGGVLLTQIHQIDWLNWIFGPFSQVFAGGGHRTDLEVDVEDTVSYLLVGSDGTPAYGHLDYLQRPKRAGMTVTGTKGRLEWDLFAHSLRFVPAHMDGEAEVEISPYDRNAMFVETMRDFLRCVKEGGRPRATLEDGRVALAITDAIKRSMSSGQAESIAA